MLGSQDSPTIHYLFKEPHHQASGRCEKKSDRFLGAENNLPTSQVDKKIAARKKTNTQNTKCFIWRFVLLGYAECPRGRKSHQKVHSFWKIAVAQVAQQTSMRKFLQLECLSLMNLFALSWIRVRVEAEMSCPLRQFLWSRILLCLYIGYLFTLPSSGK